MNIDGQTSVDEKGRTNITERMLIDIKQNGDRPRTKQQWTLEGTRMNVERNGDGRWMEWDETMKQNGQDEQQNGIEWTMTVMVLLNDVCSRAQKRWRVKKKRNFIFSISCYIYIYIYIYFRATTKGYSLHGYKLKNT
jgi:hypothetical protein